MNAGGVKDSWERNKRRRVFKSCAKDGGDDVASFRCISPGLSPKLAREKKRKSDKMRFPSRQKLLLADGARVRNFSAKDKFPEMIPDRSDILFARNKLILFFFPLSPSLSSYFLPSFALPIQNIFFIRSLLFFAQRPHSSKEDSILPIPSFVRCSFANGRSSAVAENQLRMLEARMGNLYSIHDAASSCRIVLSDRTRVIARWFSMARSWTVARIP